MLGDTNYSQDSTTKKIFKKKLDKKNHDKKNHDQTFQNPSTSNDNTDNNNKESINDDVKVECKDKPNNIEEKKAKKEQVPLNFYPNYRSTYYDPYFYGYNPYQQMPSPFPAGVSLSSRNYDDNPVIQAQQKRDKIPDVLPPPVPTSKGYKKS
ncbi:hypothetical protein HCN44_009925 [Aphidius gifuensis]|uniref:Uncharacterized protein n=1 Tax=Aphidius gifuensis TaxID=684658 RepID=A0A835CTK8_APHGI|nr:hypothetical protein HCN44_009925 [Aphidius gifuensis]